MLMKLLAGSNLLLSHDSRNERDDLVLSLNVWIHKKQVSNYKINQKKLCGFLKIY